MLSGLKHPAQIFGLVQIQSKMNLTVQSALQRNSVPYKSSYVERNLDLEKSSNPDTWQLRMDTVEMDCNVTR